MRVVRGLVAWERVGEGRHRRLVWLGCCARLGCSPVGTRRLLSRADTDITSTRRPADAATAARFAEAVALTGREFDEALRYYARSWLPARGHVKEALDQRSSVHASGAGGCAWAGLGVAPLGVALAA